VSFFSKLLGFGLRQVVGDGVEGVVEAVEQRFRDHSRTLPLALERAHDRAWQSLGVALAGDGFLDRVKVFFFATGDDRGIRAQVRAFLTGNAFSFESTPETFRQDCLDELKRLRAAGPLAAQGLPATEIALQASGFRRHADPQGLVEEARRAVAGVADALAGGYPNLALLIRRPTPSGPPLLAAAFCYFFRREVETDPELARGLLFDGLRQLSASQAEAFGQVGQALDSLGDRFDQAIEGVLQELGRVRWEAERARTAAEAAARGAAGAEKAASEAATAAEGARQTATATHGAVLDVQAELQRLGGLHLCRADEVRGLLDEVLKRLTEAGMQRGEVRPTHSCSIQGEDERRAVKALLGHFRALPPEDQGRVPALLNGLGKLQVGAGDFAAARRTFDQAASATPDRRAKAEARYNAYRAALEERQWDQALAALTDAATLDPRRFEPFPLRRYQPQRILGAGGFGTAVLCHDGNFDERVVVKTLHSGDLDRSMADVFQEAKILRKLSHPAIIGVRDCEYADPTARARPYIVMDYFPGASLEKVLADWSPLPQGQLLDIALQVAAGMKAAHDLGVCHRDLKPDNVLVRQVGDRWEAKVIDFGLALRREAAAAAGASSSAKSIVGQSLAGTVKFAPPEQLGELPGVKPGPYSDVYAFGKMVCYALFRTTQPTSRHWATVSQALHGMLERCYEHEVEYRHQHFGPVLEALESLSAATWQPPSPAPAPETVRSTCPHCHTALRIPATLLGKKLKCPKCNGHFVLIREADGRTECKVVHPPEQQVVTQPGATVTEPPAKTQSPPVPPPESHSDHPLVKHLRSRGVTLGSGQRKKLALANPDGIGGTVVISNSFDDAKTEEIRSQLPEGTGIARMTVKQAQRMQAEGRKPVPGSTLTGKPGPKRPGVIDSIAEFLQAASAREPLRKNDLLAKLAARFPDRDPNAMMNTVNTQVGGGLATRRGLKVEKNDQGGYWAKEPESGTRRERIRNKAVELLSARPEGMRHSEMVCALQAAFPRIPRGTIQGYLWNLNNVLPAEVYKPERGVFRAVRFRPAETGRESDARAPATAKAGRDRFGSRLGSDRARANAVLTAEPKSMARIVKEAGLDRTVFKHMNRLAEKGLVVKTKEGYVLPSGTAAAGGSALEKVSAPVPLPERDAEPQERAFVNSVGMEFVRIAPGTFLMGSDDDQEGSEDETQHQVTLTKGFYMGVCPVTQAQWQAVMGSNPSTFSGADRPVENVSWLDCQEFLMKLGQREGRRYALPTEAEWEYACRAGTTTRFHVGDKITTDQANYDGRYEYYGKKQRGRCRQETTEVGVFPANAWGLRDMHGNVWEWCADWYGPYPAEGVTDPQGPPDGSQRGRRGGAPERNQRVLRGGSWFYGPEYCRAASRFWNKPDKSDDDQGFRVVLRLSEPAR
jgi:formylglycine-generating enzyme required for sulfatase activity/serine/threonine protein kinase